MKIIITVLLIVVGIPTAFGHGEGKCDGGLRISHSMPSWWWGEGNWNLVHRHHYTNQDYVGSYDTKNPTGGTFSSCVSRQPPINRGLEEGMEESEPESPVVESPPIIQDRTENSCFVNSDKLAIELVPGTHRIGVPFDTEMTALDLKVVWSRTIIGGEWVNYPPDNFKLKAGMGVEVYADRRTSFEFEGDWQRELEIDIAYGLNFISAPVRIGSQVGHLIDGSSGIVQYIGGDWSDPLSPCAGYLVWSNSAFAKALEGERWYTPPAAPGLDRRMAVTWGVIKSGWGE